MGIFKKDSKLDNFKKQLEGILEREPYIKEFGEIWEQYVVKNEEIPFGSLETFREVCKVRNNSPKDFQKLFDIYSQLVYDKEDKLQNEIFLSYLKIESFYYTAEDIKIISGLFQNKENVLTILNVMINSNDVTINSEYDILNYMVQARQYYVDENAFLAACIEVIEKSTDTVKKNNIIADKLEEAKQLAGIYIIAEDEVEALYEKYTETKEKIDTVNQLLISSRQGLTKLDQSIHAISGLSKEKAEELLAEIDNYRNSFKEVQGEISEEVAKVGEKYIELIQRKLDANPGIKKSLIEKQEPVLECFNEKIPVLERLEKLKKSKDFNKLYHYCFDDVLEEILLNKSPYLVGPGGVGKTTIVSDVAELFGLKLYNVGFVADEFSAIKGYMDSTGNFVKTPFYNAFKNGGIFFIDEIDNSESKALIELNKFVSNEGYKPYLFPNDELVTPHPNFRLIAAGNTWGDGADIAYSTRENLDYSTIRRFSQIECGYDLDLERKLFDCGDEEMFAFCIAFRMALKSREGTDEFSTGDLADVNHYLKSKIKTIEKIMKLKFIKNRRVETLSSIISVMNKMIAGNKYLEKLSLMINNEEEKESGKTYVKAKVRR